MKRGQGGGCDGHRYSSTEIVMAETGAVIGAVLWEEHVGTWVTIGYITRYLRDDSNVDAYIESEIKRDLKNYTVNK